MVTSPTRRRVGTLALNLAVAIGGIIIILPLLWMVSASFKPIMEIYAFPPTLIPQNFTLTHYERLFTDWPFWSWYGNSITISLILTLLVLFFTSLAGFGFAKYRFTGSRALFTLLLGSTMVPFQLILIPLFIFMSQLGWTNSYLSLIVPFMAPAFGIFLMRQFILSIPSELIEAARIDGSTEFGIYWRIMLPLLRPALAAQGVLTFLGTWNSFLWPLAVLRNREAMTLPVGMASMIGSVTAGSEPPVGATMAAATLVSIPVILVFIAVQRQYIAGLTAASVKQ
ncbi:MAG: carbohydrate ABC transporter permease [Burkholderiales bacterium]|nr:carbohydrate ABC transporter permease [Anaerolineae bacterium]